MWWGIIIISAPIVIIIIMCMSIVAEMRAWKKKKKTPRTNGVCFPPSQKKPILNASSLLYCRFSNAHVRLESAIT